MGKMILCMNDHRWINIRYYQYLWGIMIKWQTKSDKVDNILNITKANLYLTNVKKIWSFSGK